MSFEARIENSYHNHTVPLTNKTHTTAYGEDAGRVNLQKERQAENIKGKTSRCA
jgi:hypothetical protein